VTPDSGSFKVKVIFIVDIFTAAREACHTEKQMVKITTRVGGIKFKGYFLYRTLGLHSLADLFNQTASQLLWEASIHATINARRLQTSTYVYSQVLIHTAE